MTPAATIIRRALPQDAAELSALAMRSKAHWGYSAEFMTMCEEELSIAADDITHGAISYFVAEAEASVAGYYAIEKCCETDYELEALFVEPEHIGRGIGRRLFEHALQEIGSRGGERLLIQADPNAVGFYESVGGVVVGRRESGSIPGRQLPILEVRTGK